MSRSEEAATIAAATRDRLIELGRSFIAETVASHPSKVELVRRATLAGYLVTVHVVLIPEELAVPRVMDRVAAGGHDVPHDRVLARYRRLWAHVATMVSVADEARLYDNSSAVEPFKPLGRFRHGRPVTPVAWPAWAPNELRDISADP